MSAPCPQAWHGGLHVGVLRDCKYNAGHRGAHRNESGSLSWSGKLTDEELARADALRAAVENPGHPFGAIFDGTVDTHRPKGDGGPTVTEYLRSRGEL